MRNQNATKESLIEQVFIAVWAILVVVIVLILYAIVQIPVHAVLVYLTWNYAMPVLFGLPKIGLLQSLCLVILARILIRSSNTNMGKSN